MASSYLKKKAQERAKIIDEKYGATAYGGSASVNSNRKKAEEEENKRTSKASKFLQNKVKERETVLAQKAAAENRTPQVEVQNSNQNAVANNQAAQEPRDATLMDILWNSAKRGYYNSLYGEELYDQMMGHDNEADKYEQLLSGDDYNFEANGWLGKAVSGATELLGQQARQWSNPLSLGMAGTAATAAAIAGQAGPQVLAPEEVITVPGAAIAGLQAGSTKANFEIEAGHAYKEMIDNGVSAETAKKIALGVGAGNAALEFVQLDELVKSFKVLDKVGADDAFKDIVKKELAQRGVDVAKETVQEVAQEGVTIAGAQIGNKLDKGEWAYDAGEVAGRLGDTAVSSALSFGVMNVPGGTHNVVSQTKTQKDMKAATERKNKELDTYLQDDETITALIQEGKEMGQGSASEQIANEIETKRANGQEVTRADVERLVKSNESYIRNMADPMETAAREAVAREMKIDQSEAVRQTEVVPRATLEQQVKRKTGYGDEGVKAFSALLEQSEDGDMDSLRSRFQSSYELGLTDAPKARVAFDNPIQEAAFDAGKRDYILGQSKAAPAVTAHVKAGLDTSGDAANLPKNVKPAAMPKDVTEAQAKTADAVAKALGVRVRMVSGLKGNAQINGSEVLIDENFQRKVGGSDRSLVFYVAHEIAGHRTAQLAPSEWRAFQNAMIRAQNEGLSAGAPTVSEKMTARYHSQDVDISLEGAMEEVSADSILGLYENEDAFYQAVNRIANGKDAQAKSGARKFLAAIRDVIRKIREAITSKISKEERAQAKQVLSEVEQLRDKFEAALKRGVENAENALKAEGSGDTMGAKNSLYEEGERNDGRKNESIERFLERSRENARRNGKVGGAAYSFVPAYRGDTSWAAERTAKELKTLGIKSVSFKSIEFNENGQTWAGSDTAYAIGNKLVAINAKAFGDGREIAGHEAFHICDNTAARETFVSVLSENLHQFSWELLMIQDQVTNEYFEGIIPKAKSKDAAIFVEEVRAIICGRIHSGNYENSLRKMFRDYDAVKAAWEQLVQDRANTETKNSLKSKDGTFVAPLTGENVKYSLREKEPPKKIGIAYKVFYAKDGQLYPPMVANPGGAGTPVGVWLDADIGVQAAPSKTGRPQVKAGGKGTQGGSGSLAFRPGWHLGDLPMATQFARKNPETGKKDLFPADFVWAECEYAMDHDYQDEAMSYGYTDNGKFRHSYAGLPKLPEDGYYRYRTNPNPDTVPWVITGAMKVKRILTDAETDKILRDAGVEPMKRQGGVLDLEKLGLKAGVVEGAETSEKEYDYHHTKDRGGKYSLQTDSEGRTLSEAQRRYFRNTKAVDDNGNLLVVYHGTERGGFSEFKEDNDIGFYFSSTIDMAGSYAGSEENITPKQISSWKDAQTLAAEVDMELKRVESGWELDKGWETELFKPSELKKAVIEMMEEMPKRRGVYSVYLNMENPLIVDGKGETWDTISHNGETVNTRDIARQAKDGGHDGAIIRNVMDSGDHGRGTESGDVLVVFDSKQIKSVDNTDPTPDPDIRWSLRTDSEGNELTQAQQEFFRDSKVRDHQGRLLKVYHTTTGDFTVFDKSKKGEMTGGENTYMGFFFSDVPDHMQNFPGFRDAKTQAYYLNIKNPFDMTDISKKAFMDLADVMGGDVDEAAAVYDEALSAEEQRAKVRGDNYTSLMLSSLLEEMTGDYYYADFFDELRPHYDELMARGYDGVVNFLDELTGTREYIVLESEQAKLVSNKKPTSDQDIRFSLKNPVEETKNLVALHNLTEEKLTKALNLGGFPMPSIAVTRADIPHTNFGPITLVMNKSTIDPELSRKNTVYSADAWTPTFPQIEYEADPKAQKKLSDLYYGLAKTHGYDFVKPLYGYAQYLDDELTRQGGVAGIMERLRDDIGMKQVYLAANGKKPIETIYRENVTRMKDTDIERAQYFIDQLGEDVIRAYTPRPGLSIAESKRAWVAEHGDALREAYRGYLLGNGIDSSTADDVMAKAKIGELTREVITARNYLDNGAERVDTVADTAATNEAVRAAVNQNAYEKWLDGLFGAAVKDSGIYNNKPLFTNSGNRRSFQSTHYPATLDNIAKAMAEQNDGNSRNVSGFYGVKSLRAGTAERFKSIARMHQMKGRLQHLTQEQAQAITDALDERLSGITERIYNKKKHGEYDNAFIEYDAIGNILMEVTEQSKYTVDSIQKVFSRYQYNLGNDLAADIRDLLFDVSQMPVNIFEAKPERAVRFDEVLAAVLPDNADAKLRKQLEQAGLNVLTYKADDESSRIEAVNSVDGARFSLKANEDILKENAKLKEVNQDLRNQLKRTEFAKVDKKQLDKFAKKLLRDYESGADINDTRKALDDLYTYIANGEDGMPPAWNEVQKRAYETAVSILEDSSSYDDTMYQAYKGLRDRLRTYGMTIDPQYNHDLVGYESINEFRKANMGRIKLVKDGIPVDAVYSDLAATYPEFFDEQEYSTQPDQLSHIEEVLDSLRPVEVNPYSTDMRGHATWMANDIIERFFELPQAKPTFADKAEQRLTKQVIKDTKKLERERQKRREQNEKILAETREKIAALRVKEREKREKQVTAVKERYKAKEAKGRETRKASELRERIRNHASDLSAKLLRPSDKHHIPEHLKGPVAAVLDAINLESNYTYDPFSESYKKNDDGLPTRRTRAFKDARKAYKKILEDENTNMVIDPDVEDMFDEVIDMEDTRIADMTAAQLETIWKLMKYIEHSIYTADKVLSNSKYKKTTEWAYAFQDETATRKSKTGKKSESLRLDLENPYTFFAHYGKAGEAVFRMLRDAQDKQQDMVIEVRDAVREIVDPKTVKALENETHDFVTTGGKELTLTTAHIMEIYELMKRQQANDHLLKGGIVQPEVKVNGKNIERGTDAILLNPGDIVKITRVLTKEQRTIADAMQKLTTTLLADYGNEASMAAYGYKKFTGKDYWPIKSAAEGIHSNVEKGGSNTRSIKNIGMAKATTPHANNPLDIGGLFKTFSNHAADMTDYAAWLLPMEDANRLFNFKFRDEQGIPTGEYMKGLLDKYGGKGAQKYWHNLMEDIQNGIASVSDTESERWINKMIGNVRAASVGANVRVIVQQPTAIIRAATVLSPADMAKGLKGGVLKGSGWKKAQEHSAIAKRKAMGGFDISSPTQMGEILYDNGTKLQKFNEAMMWGASQADAITWGKIWNACEWAVKRKKPSLQGQAFTIAVSELFTQVIDQSQVVDGVLQRSQIMRSGNALNKMATAFMGEPTMALNMMLRAHDAYTSETDTASRTKAKKALGRAAEVLVITNVVNALAQSLVDGLRDDDDDKGYWERVLAAFIGDWEDGWTAVLSGNLVSGLNPMGYVPYAKDILSIMQGYNVTRADADVMGDIISSAQDFHKSLTGEGKKTLPYATKNLAQQVGKMFGVSAPNILRDVWGLVRTIAIETGSVELQYEMEKAIYKISNEDNTARFADILYRAYEQGGDSYEHIYNDMIKNGLSEEKIANRMETLMKKDQGVKKVDDLEQRYLSPSKQKQYDEKLGKIQNSSVWRRASEGQKEEAEDRLYDLVEQNNAGEDLLKDIAAGAAYGVNETEYLLYKLALDMVDQPNKSGELGGTPTNEEKAAAIQAVGGLGDSEIAFLWDTDSGYEAYAAGVDMAAYVDYLGNGGEVSTDKLIAAEENGIGTGTYLAFMELLKEVDKPTESGNYGSYTQDEATAAIRAMDGLTREERAYLWQSVNKNWKANKNPWR